MSQKKSLSWDCDILKKSLGKSSKAEEKRALARFYGALYTIL